MEVRATVIVAGIDEAGLGPVLGPLVVSATAVSVDDSLAAVSLWELLAPEVSRRPARHGRSVAIGDSKKLYTRRSKAGLAHLERAVLGMLAASGREPVSSYALLSILAPNCLPHLERYPWYAGAELPLPRRITATDVAFAGNALAAAMERAGVRLTAIRSEPVLVEEFNRIVQATRNKSVALFDVTCRLLSYLWEKGSGRMRIHVDRQGGRMRYLPALQRVFGDCEFKVLQESETSSGYLLTGQGRTVEIHFSVKGDQEHLPVALASMVSKYVRELFMELFNGFWQPHVPGLEATAGYYTDGRRFYGEIQPAMHRLGVSEGMLYRCR